MADGEEGEEARESKPAPAWRPPWKNVVSRVYHIFGLRRATVSTHCEGAMKNLMWGFVLLLPGVLARAGRRAEEPVVARRENQELPAAHDLAGSPGSPDAYGRRDHARRGAGAAQPPHADRHRFSERPRAREARGPENRRARRADSAAGQLSVPHGVCRHDHAVVADDPAGLFRSGAEPDEARVQTVRVAQQPRRQPDHHPVHRGSHQSGDRGHGRRAG